MRETMTAPKALPIPCAEESGSMFLRDGFTAAYLFRKEENRLFLLHPEGTMTEIGSPAMRELILAIGERTTLGGALMLLASNSEKAVAIA
jgi:hypothetical protein